MFAQELNLTAYFTIPKERVRRRVHSIETFNVLRGGEYFFIPSLSALKWLADRKLRGSKISFRPAANNGVIGEIKCILYANYGTARDVMTGCRTTCLS